MNEYTARQKPLNKCLYLTSFGLVALLLSLPVIGQQEIVVQEGDDRILYDKTSGDYHIIYRGYTGELYEAVFVPATKINPEVKTRFRVNKNWKILYIYHLRNKRDSQQSIISFVIPSASYVISEKPAKYGIQEIAAPAGWEGVAVGDSKARVSWLYTNLVQISDGLKPGEKQKGFEVLSKDLPGIDFVELSGGVPIRSFYEEGPMTDTVSKKLNELQLNDFVPRPAAVPKIPVPTPFDAAAVLTRLKQHLNEDLVSMKLIEPVFAAALDRWLEAALEAIRVGNTVGVRANLKQFRKLLKGVHHDVDKEHEEDRDEEEDEAPETRLTTPIAKLAARVLDFDAKYVLQRLGEEG